MLFFNNNNNHVNPSILLKHNGLTCRRSAETCKRPVFSASQSSLDKTKFSSSSSKASLEENTNYGHQQAYTV